MWVVSSPYFGTTITGSASKTKILVINASDSRYSELKLLKCGQTYPVGRKEAKIIINEPWVSRTQGSFTVGPYAEGDVVRLPHLVQTGAIRLKVHPSSMIWTRSQHLSLRVESLSGSCGKAKQLYSRLGQLVLSRVETNLSSVKR